MSSIELFRKETRAWLEENCPPLMRTPTPDGERFWGGRNIEFSHPEQKQWFERMRDKGWFCPDWPTAYGGGGLNAQEVSALESELRRLKCRPAQINLGIWMLGPVLLEFGTEEQKKALLIPMARGGVGWCQGFSEPNAGSDLASLKTTARDEGDHYVVDGTKIWTSYGDKSDWMYALVRTDSSAPKHQGISLLVFDMKSPGVTVSPIDLISGKSSFCQVFFDGVKVPKSQLIGPLNGGWTLAKRLLQHERKAMSKFGEFALPTHVDLMGVLDQHVPADSREPADVALRARALAVAMDEHAYGLTVQRMTVWRVTSLKRSTRHSSQLCSVPPLPPPPPPPPPLLLLHLLLPALLRGLFEGRPVAGCAVTVTRPLPQPPSAGKTVAPASRPQPPPWVPYHLWVQEGCKCSTIQTKAWHLRLWD